MMFASALNDIKTLQILFEITDDQEQLLHYQTNECWSGLHFAAYNNKLEAMKFFLEKAAYLGKDIIKDLKDNKGNTPLIIAAGKGNVDIVDYLIEQGCDLHQKNQLGENAVLVAAKYGQLAILAFLDEKGASLMGVNEKGENATMLAAAHGHYDSFIFLMKQGVPVDLKDKQGKTIFQRALESGQIEIADLLVAGSTPEEKNDALLQAVESGDLMRVRWLVEHGASLSVMNNSKMTPMLLATSYGHLEIINYFLSLDNPPIQDKDSQGDNVLFVAIKKRHQLIVERLLKSNHFSLEDKNAKGQSPLLAAAEINFGDLVIFFHQKGCSLDAQDEEGNTALHLLLAKENLGKGMDYLLAQSLDLLLKKNKKGETPLHTAIIHKRNDQIKEIMRFLDSVSEKKAEVLEAKDEQGNTALLTAVVSKNMEAISTLH